MKEHNQLSYAVRLQRGLRLATGLDEEMGGVSRLSESLQPIIDAWSRPEWAYLIGDILSAGYKRVAAVVAEFSAAAVFNPTIDALCVVESVAAMPAAALQPVVLEERLQLSDLTTDLTTTDPVLLRDGRSNPATHFSRMVLRSGTIAGAPTLGGTLLERRFASTRDALPYAALPFVVLPGQALAVINETANAQLDVSFRFREIRLLPGQLNT